MHKIQKPWKNILQIYDKHIDDYWCTTFLVGLFLVSLNRMTLVFHCKYFICLQNVVPALTWLKTWYIYLIISLSLFLFFRGEGHARGIKLGPSAVKAWSLNHWMPREFPCCFYLIWEAPKIKAFILFFCEIF